MMYHFWQLGINLASHLPIFFWPACHISLRIVCHVCVVASLVHGLFLLQLLSATAEPATLAYPHSLGGLVSSVGDKFSFLAGFLMTHGDAVMTRQAAHCLAAGLAAAVRFAASVSSQGKWRLPGTVLNLLVTLSQGADSPLAAALYRRCGWVINLQKTCECRSDASKAGL